MKFLENAKLETLNSVLNVESHSADLKLDARVETYSLKQLPKERKAFKGLLSSQPGTSPNDPQPLSPADDVLPPTFGSVGTGGSPSIEQQLLSVPPSFLRSRHRSCSGSDMDVDSSSGGGVLCDSISTKMLFDLVCVLNVSFPDYDFTDVRSDHFTKQPSFSAVVKSIDSQLSPVMSSYQRGLRQQMWAIINEEIHCRDCNIYSYKSDYSSDPFSEDGCIWSFNYFFYNKKLKRILFISCRAMSTASNDQNEDEMWNLDE